MVDSIAVEVIKAFILMVLIAIVALWGLKGGERND